MEYLNPFGKIEKHGLKLPHWQQSETMQFVTFRLGDAMPQSRLREWKQKHAIWRHHHPKPWTENEQREYHRLCTWTIERWLDQGAGSCVLRDPVVRKIVEDVLMCDNGTKAIHHAWVLMPNHVHLLFTACDRIEMLMKAWKGVSARRIGKGSIWQKGYRDTMIRDPRHFANAVRYIRRNTANLKPGTFTLWQSDRALVVR